MAAKASISRKACTVEQVMNNGVMVRHGTDSGEIAYLTGICRPKAELKVGDKGHIAYHVNGSMGAWYWEE